MKIEIYRDEDESPSAKASEDKPEHTPPTPKASEGKKNNTGLLIAIVVIAIIVIATIIYFYGKAKKAE